MNDNTNEQVARKETLYKTAYATVSCAHFKEGDCVSVKFCHFGDYGVAWYHINQTQHGELPCTVVYPATQLTDFCL